MIKDEAMERAREMIYLFESGDIFAKGLEVRITSALLAARAGAIEECAKAFEDVNDPESAEFLRDALKGRKGDGRG